MDIIVARAVDNQQRGAGRQTLGKVDRRIIVITSCILPRQTIIDLRIDRVVVAPRGYGCHRDCHLEQIATTQRSAQCHKAAIAPTVDTDSLRIDPRERLQIACRRDLILNLQATQLSVSQLLKLLATEARTATVDANHNIAILHHCVLPTERPTIGHALRARTRILSHQHGIFLRLVEIRRTHHISIQAVATLRCEGEELLTWQVDRRLHVV